MKIKRINWPIWAGLLMTLIAFVSYFLVFVWFPVTRDFPWANLLLFAVSAVLLFVGIRRAFAGNMPGRSKVAGVIVVALSVIICGFFFFATLVMSRWIPAARGAPQVGQKAPDFTLTDTNRKTVALGELLSTPIKGKAAKGVLLIFYRGYW
jgi:type VI protein secretion system component VasK